MRLNKQFFLLPAFFFIIFCARGQDVHYNYAHGTNFSDYKTYQWIEIPSSAAQVNVLAAPPRLDTPGAPPNLPALPSSIPGGAPNFPGTSSDVRSTETEDQLIDQEIKRAIDEQLAQKGLTRVEKNADLQVVYHAAVHREVGINLSGSGWGGRGSGGLWDGSVQGQSSSIPIGTLVVDLYDPAKKQLIWRGDATKSIELKRDPDKNYKNLQRVLARLFKNYPPPPGK